MAHPGGRPTDYTPELAKRICDLIATHPVGISKICAKYDDLPCKDTVYAWLAKYDTFSDQYLVAKEKQALLVSEDLWDRSKDLLPIPDELAKYDREFRTTQWHLSKLAPKTFGDKKDKEDDAKKSHETIKNLSSAVKELAAKHEKDY